MAVTGPRGAGHPAGAARGLVRRGPAWVTLAAALVCACGRGASPATSSPAPDRTGSPAAASASVSATGTSPTPAVSAAGPHLDTAYCGSVDTTIPGAAAVIDHDGNLETPLTPVQTVWFEMASTMVPACSEITPHPPAVRSRNLTGGALSNAALQTWIQEDEEFWTLLEWAGRHGQWAFIQYLYGEADSATADFVRQGGTITDDRQCEYPEKVTAVRVTATEMDALTEGNQRSEGVAYALATVGPCTETWLAANGTTRGNGLAAGEEGREVDISETRTSQALGRYLVITDAWDAGSMTTADSVLSQVGI